MSLTDFENASVTFGLAAAAGPWLVTVIVYVRGTPVRPVARLTVLVIARSAVGGRAPADGAGAGGGAGPVVGTGAALGRMNAVELSSSGLAIGWAAVAVAVFARLTPLSDAATSTVTIAIAVPPVASEPSWQVTVCPEALQLPWPALADRNERPLGSGSVMATSVAGLGPLLTSVSV